MNKNKTENFKFGEKMFPNKTRVRKAHKNISKINDLSLLRKLCHIYIDEIYNRDCVIDVLADMLNRFAQYIAENNIKPNCYFGTVNKKENNDVIETTWNITCMSGKFGSIQ